MKKQIISLVIILAVLAGGYLYLWQGTEFVGIEKIKSYLSSFNLEAQLEESETEESQSPSQSSQISFDLELQPGIEELTEEALSLERTEETSAGTEAAAKTKLTLKEIAEELNEISLRVKIISVQAEELSLRITLAQVKGTSTTKGTPKVKTKSTLGEIAEKLNELSEKVEMVSTQAEQLLSG